MRVWEKRGCDHHVGRPFTPREERVQIGERMKKKERKRTPLSEPTTHVEEDVCRTSNALWANF